MGIKVGLNYQSLALAAYQSYNLGVDVPPWNQIPSNEKQRWISAVSSTILEFQIQRRAMYDQE